MRYVLSDRLFDCIFIQIRKISTYFNAYVFIRIYSLEIFPKIDNPPPHVPQNWESVGGAANLFLYKNCSLYAFIQPALFAYVKKRSETTKLKS